MVSSLRSINNESYITANNYQQDLKRTLIAVAKHLAKAHRYARSGKTIIEIAEAYKKITSLLDTMHILDAKREIEKALTLNSNIYVNPKDESKNFSLTSNTMLDVCPEVYTNNTYGFPFYFKGFAMLDCDRYNVRPFSQVLTLIFDFANEIDISTAGQIFVGFNSSGYAHLPLVIVAQNTGDKIFVQNKIKAYNFSATIIIYDGMLPIFDIISTEYVLMSRNLAHFDWNSQLERLVRLISYKVADLVAGSHRTISGHWMSGCYQIGLKNYSLRLIEGYDISYNSCMYCEYSSGPFIIRTKLLKKLILHSSRGQNRYLDLMLTLRSKNYVVMTCPDSMFYTQSIGLDKLTHKMDWFLLVQKWKLNRIIFPDNSDLLFTCGEAQTGCYKDKGYIVSVCCLADLTNMLNIALKLFALNNIQYEIYGGSVLSLVKFENAFPWERDHDVILMTKDLDKVMSFNKKVNLLGYKFDLITKSTENCFKSTENCSTETNILCGYIVYKDSNWRIEFWGSICLPFHAMTPINGINATLVRNAGYWSNAPLNPGLYARNRYAYQYLRHAEHWSALGENTSWIRYKTGTFSECPTPGFHGCLDNFLPDGNLQFRDIWV